MNETYIRYYPRTIIGHRAQLIIHELPHASPCCACGWNEIDQYFIDPICLAMRSRMIYQDNAHPPGS